MNTISPKATAVGSSEEDIQGDNMNHKKYSIQKKTEEENQDKKKQISRWQIETQAYQYSH